MSDNVDYHSYEQQATPQSNPGAYCSAQLYQSSYTPFFNCITQEQSATVNQQTARIQQDLAAVQSGNDPRNNSAIEADLRATFFSMPPPQVAQVEQAYQRVNPSGLSSAISTNPALSQTTRDMIIPCLVPPGATPASTVDQRTASLLDVSLSKQNPELFREVMTYASPDARQAFLNNNGAARITSAFGSDAQQSLQYAQQGRPDALSSVRSDSSGLPFGAFGSDGGVTQAVQQMDGANREKFIVGARIATSNSQSTLTAAEQDAKSYHDKMVSNFDQEGNKAQSLAWQYMIYNNVKGDSFLPSLARHYGYVGSDSISTITQDISNMSQQDWQDCKANPIRRDQISNMLATGLGKDQNDINSFLGVYDHKIGAATFQQSENITANTNSKDSTADSTSLVERMGACRGFLSTDYQQAFGVLEHISTDDRARLLSQDHQYDNYRNDVLGFMGKSEQQVAWAIIQQGQARPEDHIRAAVLDDNSSALVNQLSQLSTQQKTDAAAAYPHKYQTSMASDIINCAPDYLKPNVTQLLTQDVPPTQVAAMTREQTALARGGWTGGITSIFNGTADQADVSALRTNAVAAQLNNLQQELLTQKYHDHKDPTPEQTQAYLSLVRTLNDNLQAQHEATGNYVDSRRTISQYATAAALAPVSFGTSFGVGMAVSAVGTPLIKSFFQGSYNYDSRPVSVATDIAEAAALKAVGQVGSSATGMFPRMGIKAGNGMLSYVAGKVEQVPPAAVRYWSHQQ